MPAPVGEVFSRSLSAPVIGIGAGAGCDGQVLVTPDMLGLSELRTRYLKLYADLAGTVVDAVEAYVSEVKGGLFPGEEHGYPMGEDEQVRLRSGFPGTRSS